MQPTDDARPAPASERGAVYAIGVLIEGWKLITISVALAALLALIVASRMRERYEASVTVSTVTSSRSLPFGISSGLASQLLNISAGSGLQPTPALVARLARLQSVLLAVAAYRLPRDSVTIVERLTGRAGERLPNTTILRTMGRAITPSWDRETGLVTITVVHRDSAIARALAEQTVAEISRVFRQAARAQATELREAQQARLDSADSQLRHAEKRLVDFLSGNRIIAAHSALQAQLQSLQRAVDIAQSVYLQVRTEREAAVGRELEETPAVVVLDSLPRVLPRVSVAVGRLVAFAIVAGLVLGVAILLIRERSRYELNSDEVGYHRLMRGVASLPLVGGRLARRVAPRTPRD
jgi:uncharacterized protein involved in exopolysaccharide biosynthesis